MRFVIVLLIASFSVVNSYGDEERNSEMNIYDSGDSFRLDDGPLWEKFGSDRSENGHRSIHSNHNFNNNDDDENQQKISLKEFLEAYARRNNKKPVYYGEDSTHQSMGMDKLIQEEIETKDTKDKSKTRWTLLDVQKHKHPYDDRKGWVSLDPIPWSVSKISKWQSKYKPVSDRPWNENGPINSQRPYIDEDDSEFNRPVSITPTNQYIYNRPTESSDRYDNFNTYRDRPRPTPAAYSFPRPTAYFGHKVQLEAHGPSNSYSSTVKPYTYHNDKDWNRPNHPYDDIITDNSPPNFPQQNPYDIFKRKGTEMEIHSETHPFNGEGEWVLLSTTKGYRPPKNRQRSLDFDGGSSSEPSQTLRASRGFRLTVLPPLKGSNVNMTTSHGGLLQVESTFESVEEAKQNFDKKQNIPKIKGKRKRRKPSKKNANKFVENGTEKLGQAPQYTDPGAVVAAVGAGMIPATMAMMVPIAMSG